MDNVQKQLDDVSEQIASAVKAVEVAYAQFAYADEAHVDAAIYRINHAEQILNATLAEADDVHRTKADFTKALARVARRRDDGGIAYIS